MSHDHDPRAKRPILLQDHYLIQKMQAFDRERVPEHVVHAKGGGPWTKAAFLSQVGKRTPVLSPASPRWPASRAMPTPTGTREALVFFVRDPSKFQDFIRSQKRMPGTGLRSSNMQWDFWSLSPESLHQVAILMSDRGTPRTWRHMNGYGSHTFMWINAAGKRVWVKYHFETEQGIQNFTAAEAKAMRSDDPDYHRRDLYQAIAKKSYPAWRLEVAAGGPRSGRTNRRGRRPRPTPCALRS